MLLGAAIGAVRERGLGPGLGNMPLYSRHKYTQARSIENINRSYKMGRFIFRQRVKPFDTYKVNRCQFGTSPKPNGTGYNWYSVRAGAQHTSWRSNGTESADHLVKQTSERIHRNLGGLRLLERGCKVSERGLDEHRAAGIPDFGTRAETRKAFPSITPCRGGGGGTVNIKWELFATSDMSTGRTVV
jgi:hypothetical protein